MAALLASWGAAPKIEAFRARRTTRYNIDRYNTVACMHKKREQLCVYSDLKIIKEEERSTFKIEILCNITCARSRLLFCPGLEEMGVLLRCIAMANNFGRTPTANAKAYSIIVNGSSDIA